jgi:hypothetical protein
MKLKPPVLKSFEGLKKVADNNILIMSATDLREKGIINAAEPMVHLRKLREAKLINFTANKVGNKNPLTIEILEELAQL